MALEGTGHSCGVLRYCGGRAADESLKVAARCCERLVALIDELEELKNTVHLRGQRSGQ